MFRPSPLTVLIALLTALASGTLLCAIVRPRHPVEIADQAAQSIVSNPSTEAPVAAVVPRPVPSNLAPKSVPISLVLPAPVTKVRPAGAAKESPVSVSLRKRDLLFASHTSKMLQEADEEAFELLKIDETTRAAIRQLNEALAKRRRDILGAPTDGLTPEQQISRTVAGNREVDRLRQDAFGGLFERNSAKKFSVAEFAILGRLNRAARQWPKELAEEDPLSAGLPARVP